MGIQLADKFRKLADALTPEIEHKRRPLTQGYTPKRNREFLSRCHDAGNLERTQRALLALAYAHDTNQVPAELAGLRSKADIAPLVRKSTISSGYYEIRTADEYALSTPAALAMQAMIEKQLTQEERVKQAQREREEQIRRATDQFRTAEIPGFFPTPKPVVEMMLDAAELEPDSFILEPSAGIGSITDALVSRGVSPVAISAIELRPSLADVLKLKGNCNVVTGDFLDVTQADSAQQLFDRIIMNPPFERLQDVRHFFHALAILKPGGVLVAIMSEAAFTSTFKAAEFFQDSLRDFAAQVTPLPAGAFDTADSFRRTGIRCRMVKVRKAAKL